MLIAPKIDPIAFQIGPLAIRWYGLMYVIGFLGAYFLARKRGWKEREVSDLVFYIACGVLIGGRVGYMLFYDTLSLLREPMRLFRVWEGGMSFHGGFLGVLVAVWLFARHSNKKFFVVTDFIAPLIPIGLATGRLGNFINSELWGKATTLPWGIAPVAGALPRHPTQLYEFLLEGILLFTILWFYSRKPRPLMATSALFLIWYGVFRFAVEFVRLPDAHLGYLAWGWLTMGQVLTVPMIIVGLCMIYGTISKPTQTHPS